MLQINKKGSILLLALLVLSGSLLTGLTIGTIVLSELRQSRNLDNAIVAYHAAASGVEQALYYYRKDFNEFEVQVPKVPTGAAPGGNEEACNFASANFFGECEYYYENAAGISFPLTKGSVRQINLFDDDLLGGYGVEYLEIDWWDQNLGNSLEPWLEMEIIELPNNWDGVPARETINLVRLCSDGAASYTTSDPADNPDAACGQWVENGYISTGNHYKVRFRSLYDDVRVVVSARDGVGDLVGAREINISANGVYNNSNQAVRARVSNVSAAKGLTDFVLFTDCDIVKGISVSSVCP